MPLLLKTHYQLAKKSLKKTRLRSFLTCLGVAIGVASLTLILSLSGSITALISSQVSSLGEGLVIIRPSQSKSEVDSIVSTLASTSTLVSSTLSMSDLEVINSTKNISLSTPISVTNLSVKTSTTDVPSVPVLATTSDFIKIQNYPLSSGVFFNSSTAENAVILGHSVASRIFGNESPVSKTLELQGERFIITGVLAKIDDPINFNNVDLDNSIIVSADYFEKTFNIPLQISQINLRLAETSLMDSTISELNSALVSAKHDSNFTILSGADITHPSGSLLNTTTLVLSIISAISLIVGGIGIMNIMLVSVTERTHEIGIRKSVGATNSNIFGEFLIESLLLSVKGGALGIILGYGLAFAISLVTPFAMFFSWQILAVTFATAIITGTFFGVFPALNAAKKDPIRSLKTYY